MLVNARLVLFGGALAPQWKGASGGFRALAAYLLTDPVFVLGMARGGRPGTAQERAYYLGAAVTLWVTWQVVTAASLLLGGGVLPAATSSSWCRCAWWRCWCRRRRRRAHTAAALAAAGAALAATTLPAEAVLPLATVVGIVAGVAAERVVVRSSPIACVGCRP